MRQALFFATLVCSAIAHADVLTNDVIARMAMAKVPEETIIRSIQTADEVSFNLAPSATDWLLKVGVSETVIKAMAARLNRPSVEPEAGQPVPAAQPAATTSAHQSTPWPQQPGAPVVRQPRMEPIHEWDEWYLRPGRAEVAARIGISASPDFGDGYVKLAPALETAVGIAPMLAAIASYGYTRLLSLNIREGFQSVSGNAALHELTGGLRISLPARVSPYALALAGGVYARGTVGAQGTVGFSDIVVGEDAAFAYGGGGGLNIGVTRRIGVQTDFRYLRIHNGGWYGRATFGTYYRFH
jgi:hypothetical protein